MANWNDPQPRTGFGASPSLNGDVLSGGVTFDAGLRKHMLSIYNYMSSGVLLSGIVSLLMAKSGLALQMVGSPLLWVVMLAPLAFIWFFNANRSTSTLQIMFWAFCTVMGMSMSTIFLVYTASSIAGTFFATAGAFAGLSLYGYTTKRNLGPIGAFLSMGVFGLLFAMIVNAIWPMPGLSATIPFLGVLIFAGLTAYHTQFLKDQYARLRGTEFAGKAVILGALQLYLDFINMFQFLLSFLGSRD
jgi:FtsH-binding integral membrane protein